MGLDFRRTLIDTLEKRQQEIEATLAVLHHLKQLPLPAEFRTQRPAPIVQLPLPPLDRSHSGPRRGEAVVSQILQLRDQGLSLRAIAAQVSLSHAAVWKVLRKARSSADGQAKRQIHAAVAHRG